MKEREEKVAEGNGLTGAHRAALLIMLLDEEKAAAILRNMSERAVKRIIAAAKDLDPARVDDARKREALIAFLRAHQRGGFVIGDTRERFKKLLARAKGEDVEVEKLWREDAAEEEKKEKESARKQLADLRGLMYVSTLSDEEIAGLLEDETARVAAALLAHMGVEFSGRVLNLMDEEKRESIVERILTNEHVSREVAEVVADALREKKESLSAGEEEEEGDVGNIVKILGGLKKEARQRILSKIESKDPELAEEVKRRLFVFSDLINVDRRQLAELLRRVEVQQLALAIKGIPKELEEHILSGLSQRVRDQVVEERELAGKVPVSVAEEAREAIMAIAREMYTNGEIELEGGGQEYVE